MAYKIIDEQDRSKLSEGRNKGFATAFLKKSGNIFTTVNAKTCCKDFDAEIIVAEHINKSYKIYGLHYLKQDIFDKKKDVAYKVCSILGINRGGKHTNYDRDYKALETNYKNVAKLLNYFEKHLKVKKLTKIEKVEDNLYLITLPLFWCDSTWQISLYGFLLRVAIFWDGEGSPMDFLNNFDVDAEDKMMFNSIRPKLERIMMGEIPKQDMASMGCPHSVGIIGFNFPKAADLYPKSEAPQAKPANNLQPIKF